MYRSRSKFLMGVAAASAVLLAACGGSADPTPTSNGGGETSDVEAGAGEFSMRMPDRFMNWLLDQKWYPLLQENSGIEVELIDGGPSSNYYQQIDLDLTSQGLGDAAVVNLAQLEMYGNQGAFLDLNDLIAEHGPNIQAFMDANEDFKNLVTSEDGSVYGLIYERPKIGPVTFYRKDLAEKAGITQAPRTVDEFTDFLRALKENSDDPSDFFPLSGRDRFLILQHFFEAQNRVVDGQVQGYNSQLNLDLHADGAKDMMAWYNMLYEEGLIDPAYVRGGFGEDSWQTSMLTGTSAVAHDFFTRPTWFMQNGGPESDPDYAVEVIYALENEAGDPLMVPANARFDGTRILAIDHQSENAVDVIKFIDYLYSEEGMLLMQYGVEGETFEYVDGEPEYLVKFDDVAASPVGTPVWAFHQDRLTFPVPMNNDAYYSFLDEFTESFASEYFGEYTEPRVTLRYNADELGERSDLMAGLEPFIEAELTKFATGDRSLDTWAEFIDEVNSRGYERLVEIDQGAWERMNG